jgi:Uma2 family endonuclease
MTSAASRSSDLGYAGLLMRADDFFALGQTPERYELINGVVVMSPSPRPRHWKVVEEILFQLREHARRSGPLDTYADIDIFLDDLTVYRPDLCVYARPRPSPIPERLVTPPDIVLEVLSAGSKPLDLITKRDAYERFGVREYWTMDPDDGRLRAWTLQQGRYRELPEGSDRLTSAAVPGIVIDLAAVRALLR